MKTHWLYGEGPDKRLRFAVEVDTETKCSTCLHREVCNIDMEKRCSNYSRGNSGSDCSGCIHKFTRYDKDHVPCFHCKWYLTKETTGKQLIMEQKYSHVKSDGTLETWDDTVKRVTENVMGVASTPRNLMDKEKKLS